MRHLSNEKNSVCLGYVRDSTTIYYMGIMICPSIRIPSLNNYIFHWKVFFMAHLSRPWWVNLSDEKVNLWGGLDALCQSQRWPMFCSPGKEMAWRFWKPQKQASSPQKKSYPTQRFCFFRPKNEIPPRTLSEHLQKKDVSDVFFSGPPPVQKVIHHDPSLQKISKKNPSKMQVKISSSARFGVLVLCSWPQSFFGKKITPRAAECYQPPRRGKAIHLAVGEDRVLRLRLHWFQVFENPNFAPKKMVESERCLTCLVCFHEEKDYKVAKMPLRDSCVEELYLGLGDIFNMVESFEWKFQKLLQVFRDAED